eukprot:9514977-Karenia_brevis.AAC.1
MDPLEDGQVELDEVRAGFDWHGLDPKDGINPEAERAEDLENVSERSDPFSGIDLAKDLDLGIGHGDEGEQLHDETWD